MSNQTANLEIMNMGEFQRTLNKYLAITSRELPSALNHKMFFIARAASRMSPKANKATLERELGVVGYKVKVGKRGKPLTRKGKPRWERVISNSATLAALIVNARRGRAGKSGLFGAEMKAAVAKLISSRVLAIGTIKAGWWNAIRAFGRAVGQYPFREVNTRRIKGATKYRLAKDGFSPEASLEYLTNSFDQQHNAYIDQRTREALQRAYADELRSMQKYIIDKLQKQADKLSRP